jgi:hypothetical protein
MSSRWEKEPGTWRFLEGTWRFLEGTWRFLEMGKEPRRGIPKIEEKKKRKRPSFCGAALSSLAKAEERGGASSGE